MVEPAGDRCRDRRPEVTAIVESPASRVSGEIPIGRSRDGLARHAAARRSRPPLPGHDSYGPPRIGPDSLRLPMVMLQEVDVQT